MISLTGDIINRSAQTLRVAMTRPWHRALLRQAVHLLPPMRHGVTRAAV
jgi:hypothetical protein